MPELDLERDDRFLRRERRFHRVVVAGMAVVLLVGLLGVFGIGPLAATTKRGPGFDLTYDRFARNGAPLTLEVQADLSGEGSIWLDSALIRSVQVNRVVPAPLKERRTQDGATFTFHAVEGRQETVTFQMTGDTWGLVRGRAGLSPKASVPVTILFYP